MNQKKYTISAEGSAIGPRVWESVEARVWATVSARKGSITGITGCTSFVACGGGRRDGVEEVMVVVVKERDVPLSSFRVVEREEQDMPLSPLRVVEEKEEVVVVVVEKEWDVPLFLIGMVEKHEQYA